MEITPYYITTVQFTAEAFSLPYEAEVEMERRYDLLQAFS
jgi:hypothetical protein